ncbi:hypothetical protein CRUP_037963 [Coryphaenoides rupestris]|nr:hypothetical protein CRUP_037963 [Coryphaenoides rupestris]
MVVNIAGVVTLVVFYCIILLTGIWASRKSSREEKKCQGGKSEVAIVGGRNINVLVGVFTMTATWVGGGYIMGTAEAVYSPELGLVWAISPFSYILNFFLAGMFLAKPMRSKRYVTMLDPFQHSYGNSFTTALLVPALICDILWVACTLAALGGTISVILGISSTISISVSAVVAIIYTLMGGLYSVAYTDVIQLCFIAIGMWVSVPFVLLNPASMDISQTAFFNLSNNTPWLGDLKLEDAGRWTDDMLILTLGSLAYQSLHQRILSAASSTQAQLTCYGAGFISSLLGLPSILIGAVAASTGCCSTHLHHIDWNQTEYGLPPPYERGDVGKILPLALQYLTPSWVSVLGISALAAAVMSSMDSALLSSASMFTQNIYKSTLRKGLICVLYCRHANVYGAISGYLASLLLRLLGGEPKLGLPCVIYYPGWREEDGVVRQNFPHRTLAFLTSLVCIPAVSFLAQLCFTRHLLPLSWDVLRVFGEKEQAETGAHNDEHPEKPKFFYCIILLTGVWASQKSSREEKKCQGGKSEVAIVGGRNINVVVGVFTMTAGMFLAKPMRSKRYVTMLDPFQHSYGNSFTTALLVPALISDILCMACVLAALVFYCIILLTGIWASRKSSREEKKCQGGKSEVAIVGGRNINVVVGVFTMTAGMFLAKPMRSKRYVTMLDPFQHSYGNSFTTALLVPALISDILCVACVLAALDWNQTEYGLLPPYERGDVGKILPLALQYLTPSWVSVLGISALAAAGMSSMDSILLSSASMFTQNIYKSTLRKGLICVLYCRHANVYGAISGYVASLLLRLLGGESQLGLPCVIYYPGWREEDGVVRQYFPHRTLAFLTSLVCIPAVSFLVQLCFTRRLLPLSWDVLRVFGEKEQAETEAHDDKHPEKPKYLGGTFTITTTTTTTTTTTAAAWRKNTPSIARSILLRGTISFFSADYIDCKDQDQDQDRDRDKDKDKAGHGARSMMDY